jgi:hypothetical protein
MCMTQEDYGFVQKMVLEVSEIETSVNGFTSKKPGKEQQREQARQRTDHIVTSSSYLNQHLKTLSAKCNWSNSPSILWEDFKTVWRTAQHFDSWQPVKDSLNLLSMRIRVIKPTGPDTPRTTIGVEMLAKVKKYLAVLATDLNGLHTSDATMQQRHMANIQEELNGELKALFPKFCQAFAAQLPNTLHEWQQFIETWSDGNGDPAKCYALIQTITTTVSHVVPKS